MSMCGLLQLGEAPVESSIGLVEPPANLVEEELGRRDLDRGIDPAFDVVTTAADLLREPGLHQMHFLEHLANGCIRCLHGHRSRPSKKGSPGIQVVSSDTRC